MKGWVKIGSIVFLAAMLLSSGKPVTAAPDVNEAKKQAGELLKNAQAMVEHGHAAHPAVMTKYAKATIETAQKVLDSIPPGNKHGEAAAEQIKAVIEQANTVINDQSVDNAEQALNHATAAEEHVRQM